MARLIVLRGLSGSGKSDYARKSGMQVVSRDLIRRELTGRADKFAGEGGFERRVTDVQIARVKALLGSGFDVVIDDTNVRRDAVHRWGRVGAALGVDIEVVSMPLDLEAALLGNAQRPEGQRVPEDVIRRQYAQWEVM